MKRNEIVTTLALTIIAFAGQAQYLEVNMSSQFNTYLQSSAYTDGTDYQVGGSQLNVSGVPFQLGLLSNTPGTTGIIQVPANGGQTQSYTFSIPAGTQATELYSLVNSYWGEAGVNEGSIVVTGSLGETATLNLIEGDNVRDHYDGVFCNTLSDPTVVPTYFSNQAPSPTGLIRLDRQELLLPSSFNGDTVASITFNGIGYGEPNGMPFLAAMTLQTVPEPTPLELSGLGALVLAILRWKILRKRQTA